MTTQTTIQKVGRELCTLTERKAQLARLLIVECGDDDEVELITSGPEFDMVNAELKRLDAEFDVFLRETLSAEEYRVYLREMAAAEGAN